MIVNVDRTKPRQYAANGLRYFGVTSICHVMDGAPAYGSEQDLQRGTYLHTIFALAVASFAGRCAPPSVPSEYAGYYASMWQWIERHKPEPILQESPAVCLLKHVPIGGTPDLLAWIQPNRRRALIDLKSGQPARWHKAQVMAYAKLEGYTKADVLGLLYIDKDGRPPIFLAVKSVARDWAAFQSALNLLIWRES